jgi:hypothetical protein
MSSLRPICVKCRLEMRTVRNDRPVADPKVGQFPSTYWLGDECECPECKSRVVVGFGRPMPGNARPAAGLGPILHFDYQRRKEAKG